MKRQGIVVLGMHRGGTSAVAGVLRALGVDFGKALLPPRPDNPLGFFEHRTVVRQHDALLRAAGAAWDEPLLELDEGEWRKVARRPLAAIVRRLRADFSGSPLWGLKDPRMCRLLPLWRPAFARLGVVPRFLFVLRHPAEVAASLHARDRVDSRKAQLLWLEHLLTAEAATRGESRLFLTYDSLLADWRGAVARIGEAFRIVWPRPPADAAVAAEIDGFLQPALRHHRAAAGLAGLRVAEEVFAWLSQLAAAPAPAAEISPLISDALDARRQLLGEITWRDTEANRCLRADRRLAQEIMDSQKVELADLRQASAALRADRAEAQRIMDALAAERDAARADFATLLADRKLAQEIMDSQKAELAHLHGMLALASGTFSPSREAAAGSPLHPAS